MEIENQKDWVVLFYLNGNNELAPEIFQARLSVEAEGSDENVDILIQHGSIENRIVEIIRPKYKFWRYSDELLGVQRYHAGSTDWTAYESLENTNMADPKNLYDFVRWGMENYPAKHYMLVLGGHVFQYVGLMPDYSQDKPYLMGYPEMINALTLIHKTLGKKIDMLVLDTCYANRIEMLYELGKDEDPPVSQVLTYISGGPINGMPYDDLIKILKKYYYIDASEIVRKIIDDLHYDLIAYEINHDKLQGIKKSYNDLACCFLDNKPAESCSPTELLTNFDEKLPWYSFLTDLAKRMPSLTIDYKNISGSPFGHFYVSAQIIQDPYKIALYNKLAFARYNFWTHLLCTTAPASHDVEGNTAFLKPYTLNPSELYALVSVMNPYLNFEENSQIVHKLIDYKGWN